MHIYYNGERSGNLSCRPSMLLSKPRLSINLQLCCQSHGCPSIVNAVVEATLSSKWRIKRFGKGKKRWCQWECTALRIFQVMFFLRSDIALLWNELPTVYTCVSWPLLTVYGLLLVGGGQTWLHYALHRWTLYRESDVLLVLTVISGFPLSGHNVEVTA